MITKICCKKEGLVENNEFTSQGIKIRDYVLQVTGEQLTPEDFRNSPSERTIAKLVMNSFYGKWGQRSSFPETKTFNEQDENEMKKCERVLTDLDIDVDFGQIIEMEEDRRIILLEYTRKKAVLRGDKFKNDLIAAHVTAYGRIMLIKAMVHASQFSLHGCNVIGYADTDSIMFLKHDIPIFQTGFRIGDLEMELDNGQYAVWMKRKSYAYETANGKVVLKQKGVALKQSHAFAFTYQKLLQLVQDSYDVFQKLLELGLTKGEVVKRMRKNKNDLFPSICVNQTNFQTVRNIDNPLLAWKKTLVQQKHTFGGIADAKRVPMFDRWKKDPNGVLDTLPFGYKTEFFY